MGEELIGLVAVIMTFWHSAGGDVHVSSHTQAARGPVLALPM